MDLSPFRGSAKQDTNQMGLFASAGVVIDAPEPPLPPDTTPWSDKETLEAEHEALGFYITAHPLDKYEADLKRFTTGTIETLKDREHQTKVTVGGVIQSLRLRNSKKRDRYASFTLEDKSGTVEVVCWPETYRKTELDFTTREPVCVSGTLEVGEERCQLIADEVVLLVHARQRTAQEVHLALRAERITEDSLHNLRNVLTQHPGDSPCFPAPAAAEPVERG